MDVCGLGHERRRARRQKNNIITTTTTTSDENYCKTTAPLTEAFALNSLEPNSSFTSTRGSPHRHSVVWAFLDPKDLKDDAMDAVEALLAARPPAGSAGTVPPPASTSSSNLEKSKKGRSPNKVIMSAKRFPYPMSFALDA